MLAFAAVVGEVLDELAEAGLVQRRRDPRVGIVEIGCRAGDQLLQRQRRQLDVLRGIEGSHAFGEDDVPRP